MAQTQTDRVYDALLVTQARRGDRRAAERLAARWYPRLLRTARRLLRDEEQAREAVQEAWTGICRGWYRLNQAEKFPAWAYGILRRKCTDRLRLTIKNRDKLVSDEALETLAAPQSPVALSDIEKAFDDLPEPQRLCAIFYFAEGLSLREVATAAAIPVGTAKSRLFHARKALQASLKGENDESV